MSSDNDMQRAFIANLCVVPFPFIAESFPFFRKISCLTNILIISGDVVFFTQIRDVESKIARLSELQIHFQCPVTQELYGKTLFQGWHFNHSKSIFRPSGSDVWEKDAFSCALSFRSEWKFWIFGCRQWRGNFCAVILDLRLRTWSHRFPGIT